MQFDQMVHLNVAIMLLLDNMKTITITDLILRPRRFQIIQISTTTQTTLQVSLKHALIHLVVLILLELFDACE